MKMLRREIFESLKCLTHKTVKQQQQHVFVVAFASKTSLLKTTLVVSVVF